MNHLKLHCRIPVLLNLRSERGLPRPTRAINEEGGRGSTAVVLDRVVIGQSTLVNMSRDLRKVRR
jgi:hypothetical protein